MAGEEKKKEKEQERGDCCGCHDPRERELAVPCDIGEDAGTRWLLLLWFLLLLLLFLLLWLLLLQLFLLLWLLLVL